MQAAQQQIDQLKSLIAQYQAREKQYQTTLSQDQQTLSQYQQQLNNDNAQVQQLENILVQLQRAGVIQIGADGSVTLGRTRGFGDGGR